MRYWREEPWGPYRDNLHAAIIAREVRRTAFKGDHKIDAFMVIAPEKSQADGKAGVFAMLKSMAKRVKREKK